MKTVKNHLQASLREHLKVESVIPAKSIQHKKGVLTETYQVSVEPEEFNSFSLGELLKELAKHLLIEVVTWAYNKLTQKFDFKVEIQTQIEIDNDLKLNGLEINEFTTDVLRVATRRLKLSNYQMSVLTGLSTGTISLHMRGKRVLEYKHKISYLTGLRRFIETGRVQNDLGKHRRRK